MKYLKNDAYNALDAAAKNWNTLVQKVLENNKDMKAEDVTPEMLLEAMESDDDSGTSDLQTKLDDALEQVKQKDAKIEELTSENEALKGTPAGKKDDVTTGDGGEPLGGGGKDIKDFAAKNEGDTLAIMAEAEKTGFFKH